MNSLNQNNLLNFEKKHLVEIIIAQSEIIEQLESKNNHLESRITELENQFKKDSSNSSKPPAADFQKKNQSLRQLSDKKSGGQKGHQGTTRKQTKNPDKIISLKPKKCSHWGKDLEGQIGQVIAKRQEIDIPPIKPIITEYQQEEIKCSCGHCNKGEFPDHIKSRFQLGQNLKSFRVLNLKTI